MKKHKIAFLIPRLGITDRGAEIFVFELSKHLSIDFEITILTRRPKVESKMVNDLLKMGITIKKVSCVAESNWLTRRLYSTKLGKFLEVFHISPNEIEMLTFSLMSFPYLIKSDYDILFPVNGIWGAVLCRIVRVIKGTPFVYTSVGGIEPLIARQKPNIYFTINPRIKRWFKSHFPKIRVEFISTGVNLKKFKPQGKKAQINLPRPVFLTVSALVPEKRIDLTIKAVGKLKQGSLLVVGDGPLKSELTRLALKILGKDRFHILSVGHYRMPEFYRTADVFTHSAPWEVGWGLVHLEALASGLPVVANREENLEFLISDQRFLCDVENTEEYSLCLDRTSKEKRGMYWRNKVKNYSWEKVAKKYKDLLLEVLSST